LGAVDPVIPGVASAAVISVPSGAAGAGAEARVAIIAVAVGAAIGTSGTGVSPIPGGARVARGTHISLVAGGAIATILFGAHRIGANWASWPTIAIIQILEVGAFRTSVRIAAGFAIGIIARITANPEIARGARVA
jgi:hypothetical protein